MLYEQCFDQAMEDMRLAMEGRKGAAVHCLVKILEGSITMCCSAEDHQF